MNTSRILLWGTVAAVLLWGGAKVVSLVRGIRNNNPGNIRLSSTTWAGQVDASHQTDPAFVQFVAPEYGIRAMARILRSYAARGADTVREIISTWAPPTENDTGAYIQSVASQIGVSPDTPIGEAQFAPLIAAIIRHENGIQPYDGALLTRGISMV